MRPCVGSVKLIWKINPEFYIIPKPERIFVGNRQEMNNPDIPLQTPFSTPRNVPITPASDVVSYLNAHNDIVGGTCCIGDRRSETDRSGRTFSNCISRIRPDEEIQTVPYNAHTDIRPISFPGTIQRVYNLLSGLHRQICTLPAFAAMQGVAVIELDNLLVKIGHEKALIESDFFSVYATKQGSVEYGQWAKKLGRVMDKLYVDESSLEDVCYFQPGFDFESFVTRYRQFRMAVWSRLEVAIDLLDNIQKMLDMPSDSQLIDLYNEFERQYQALSYDEDNDAYQRELFGIPKHRREAHLKKRLKNLKEELYQSGFFKFFDEDPATAWQELHDDEDDDLYLESVTRYIWGHRADITQEMIMAFFRCEIMSQRVREDLAEIQLEKSKKSPARTPRPTSMPATSAGSQPIVYIGEVRIEDPKEVVFHKQVDREAVVGAGGVGFQLEGKDGEQDKN